MRHTLHDFSRFKRRAGAGHHPLSRLDRAVESPDKSLAQLASAGFLVVAPDCYEHGERRSDAWFRAQFNGWAVSIPAKPALDCC